METITTQGDSGRIKTHKTEVLTFKWLPDINCIEVIFREPSNMILTSYPPKPAPDKIWKEIYSVNGFGQIVLIETKIGNHVPSSVNVERFEFD